MKGFDPVNRRLLVSFATVIDDHNHWAGFRPDLIAKIDREDIA